MNDNTNHLLDEERSACLCDVGQADYIAATAVDANGSEHLVFVERSAMGDLAVRYDSTCRDVAHEQLGPLPAIWRHRAALAPLRCGRPTKAGRPCRALVADPGPCSRHRESAHDRQTRP